MNISGTHFAIPKSRKDVAVYMVGYLHQASLYTNIEHPRCPLSQNGHRVFFYLKKMLV